MLIHNDTKIVTRIDPIASYFNDDYIITSNTTTVCDIELFPIINRYHDECIAQQHVFSSQLLNINLVQSDNKYYIFIDLNTKDLDNKNIYNELIDVNNILKQLNVQ